MTPATAANDLETCDLMGLADAGKVRGDWVSDPQQLADWQDQLVRVCEDINCQLSQIQQSLSGQTENSLRLYVCVQG